MTVYSFTSVKQTDGNKGMQKGTSNYDVKGSDVISSKLKLTYVDSKMYFFVGHILMLLQHDNS